MLIIAKISWSGTSYCRIHFLPFTRDGRGYAQNTPFINLWNLKFALASDFLFVIFIDVPSHKLFEIVL